MTVVPPPRHVRMTLRGQITLDAPETDCFPLLACAFERHVDAVDRIDAAIEADSLSASATREAVDARDRALALTVAIIEELAP